MYVSIYLSIYTHTPIHIYIGIYIYIYIYIYMYLSNLCRLKRWPQPATFEPRSCQVREMEVVGGL